MQSGRPRHARIFDKMDIINVITNTYSRSIKAVDTRYRNTIYSTGFHCARIQHLYSTWKREWGKRNPDFPGGSFRTLKYGPTTMSASPTVILWKERKYLVFIKYWNILDESNVSNQHYGEMIKLVLPRDLPSPRSQMNWRHSVFEVGYRIFFFLLISGIKARICRLISRANKIQATLTGKPCSSCVSRTKPWNEQVCSATLATALTRRTVVPR